MRIQMKKQDLMIKKLIQLLDLKPHPEGGWYRETWRSEETFTRTNGTERASGTAIYFLIPQGVKTHWHKVNSAEIWHFYSGAPLVLELKNWIENNEIIYDEDAPLQWVDKMLDNNSPLKRWFKVTLLFGSILFISSCTIPKNTEKQEEIIPIQFSLEGLNRKSKFTQFLDIFNLFIIVI